MCLRKMLKITHPHPGTKLDGATKGHGSPSPLIVTNLYIIKTFLYKIYSYNIYVFIVKSLLKKMLFNVILFSSFT